MSPAVTCALLVLASFDLKTATVDGDILDVAAQDLDGDAQKDLLVLYKTGVPPKEERRFALFWSHSGRYFERPDVVLPVSEEACAFDVADADTVAGDELLLVAPSGVVARRFAGRKISDPIPLTQRRVFFLQADRGYLPRLHLIHDLSQTGGRELIVHAPGGLDIFRRTSDSFEPASTLDVKMDAELDRGDSGGPRARRHQVPELSTTLRFPAIAVIDTNSDGLKDLVLTLDDRISIYRQSEGLKFPAKANYARDFAVRTEEDRKQSYSSAGISVVDLDLDGAADLVVRKTVAKGITSARSETMLFLASKEGTFSARADQLMVNEGASRDAVELVDVTGDRVVEMFVPAVDIGIGTIIRYLTTETFVVDVQVFSFDKNKRRFADKALASRELSFDLDLEGEADSAALDMNGDFNGDGLPDLAFGTEIDELAIYRGLGKGTIFTEEPAERVAVRGYGRILAVDLENKGRSDLVLYYPRTQGHRNRLTILRNTSGK